MMREMRWLLVALVACSSRSPSPTTKPVATPKPVPVVCTDGQLGGYDGSPECAATAATPIPGADRSCTSNEDCIRLGPHCAPFAIRADRTDAYSPVPCTNPTAGQCPPPCAAVCREGCCVIPAGWGEACR
jgi:hypothetical protein